MLHVKGTPENPPHIDRKNLHTVYAAVSQK